MHHYKFASSSRYLVDRQIGLCSIRRDLKVVRALVTSSESNFEVKWERTSNKNIHVNEHIFFNNFTEARTKEGLFLYNIARPTNAEQRIKSVLVYELALHRATINQMIALSENGYILRYNLYTGEQLGAYLSAKWSDCKFNFLAWDSVDETFYLRSTISHSDQSITIAVFQIEPFGLLGKFKVKKSVFGKTMKNVTLENGILFVSHSKNTMKCYNLRDILQSCCLKEYDPLPNMETLVHDQGIPDTHEMNEVPPSLVDFTSQKHFLEYGGEPLVYIHSPFYENDYMLNILETDEKVKNGEMTSGRHPILMDKDSLGFYDNSYKLLLQRPSHIEIFKLQRVQPNNNRIGNGKMEMDEDNSESQSQIALEKVFEVWSSRPTETCPDTLRKVVSDQSGFELYKTKRGRNTRILNNTAFGEREIEHVDYENELDLLVVVMHHYVYLYDNVDGKFLKRIKLRWWPDNEREQWQHTVVLDKDTLVHMASNGSKTFLCHVYVLKR